METQNRWGVVALATGFAAIAIAVAVGASLFGGGGAEVKKPSVVAMGGGGSDEWRTALEEVLGANIMGTSTVAATGGLVGLAPTDALAAEFAQYYGVLADPAVTNAERDGILRKIAASVLPSLAETPTLALDDIPVSATVSAGAYADLLVAALRRSSEVREYELATFLRMVTSKNYSGSPELAEDATIYRSIRDELAATTVPIDLATEHLAAVNSLGALASIVAEMSAWSGDPIVGLAYLNAFDRAESSLSSSIERLFARIKALSS